MTPAYLRQLADIADPDQLWRLAGLKQLDLPTDKKNQLNMGVALRRHASHLEQLEELRVRGKSLLITPLAPNHIATRAVDTPEDHAKWRREASPATGGSQ